jgi:hypothetical protein
MSVLSKLTGTLQTTFQIGKAGPKVKAPTTTTVALVAADGSTEVQGQLLSARINNQTTLLGSSGVLQVKDAAGSNEAQVQALSARINNQATLTAAAGSVTVKDAAGSSNAKVFAADPLTTDLQGLVTVAYINANPPSSAAQIRTFSLKSPFTGAPTFTGINLIPDNAIITRCVVEVVSALLDAGPAAVNVKVGTDEVGQDARFQAFGDNDTQVTGTYETTPFIKMKSSGGGSTQKFVVTTSATPASGEVSVFIEYLVPQAA